MTKKDIQEKPKTEVPSTDVIDMSADAGQGTEGADILADFRCHTAAGFLHGGQYRCVG